MNNSYKLKNSAKELNKQIEQHLVELAQATDKARTSEEMLRYLDFCAKFHQYSAGNIWLIMLAKPDATYVAGFHKWKSMGRWVQKGERGIPILAPVLVKDENNEDGIDTKRLVGFKTVYVFDVSQTEGEPLPPIPDWKSPEKNLELNKRLIKFAEIKGIKVSFKKLPGDIQGVSKGNEIEVATSAGTKTLVHEIAHELMHQGNDMFLDKANRELEAESVAFVVCKHFGIGNLNSPNYIALHDASTEKLFAHMTKIQGMANEIIIAISLNSCYS